MKTITEITVRYKETDKMGVVHHSNYLVWMEQGRTDLIKKLGISYSEIENMGYILPVVRINLEYLSPCYYEEKVKVETTFEGYKGPRLIFSYNIFKENNKIACKGYSEHVFLDKNRNIVKLSEDFFKNFGIDYRMKRL